MNKKMNKKTKYLIIWSVSLTVTLILSFIGQALFPNSEDQQSSLYFITYSIITTTLIVFVVFLLKWFKTCPVCKEGKMILIDVEKGDSEIFTYDKKVTDRHKDSKGKLYKTVNRKEQRTGISTEYTNYYKCNNCDHTHEKTVIKKQK